MVIFVVFFVVTKATAAAATAAAADDDDDADAVFLIKIEIDEGLVEVGAIFATAAKVTKIDSMTLIGDDDD